MSSPYSKSTKKLFLLLVIFLLSDTCDSVESPLETMNNQLKAIKLQMNSVQQTLITSVSLIQDQMTELTNEMTTKLDSKLTLIDSKLVTVDGKVSQLQDRAHVWDTLQHHVSAWNSLMKSVDDKINHISRSQEEKFTQQSLRLERLPDVEFKLETVAKKVDDIERDVGTLDSRLISIRDGSKQDKPPTGLATTLRNIEDQLNNMTSRRSNHRVRGSRQRVVHEEGAPGGKHRSGHNSCKENREILEEIQSKVEVVYQKSTNDDDYSSHQSSNTGPRFDYLRSKSTSSQVSHDIEPELGESENQISKMLRKLATPFSKANIRLKKLEEVQGKFGEMMAGLQTNLKTSLLSMENKFNDWYTMSGERFEQQNSQMERYSANFAEILHCCKGHSSDFERFTARGSPVLDNLDTWMVTWTATANQKFDRVLDQLRFNTNRLVTGHKQLERIVVEGLDGCQREKAVVARRRQVTTAGNHAVTERIKPEKDMYNDDTIVEEKSEDYQKTKVTLFKGCEDLRKSGVVESKVFNVGQSKELNQQQRDFNRRFCDQDTSGGGWTVIQRRGNFGFPHENFSRSWRDYKHGFGDLNGEFWFGNDYISKLTREQSMVLRIDLEDHNGTMATAEYTTFRVDPESDDYRLWVGGYSGNATDSLSNHSGYKFSTIDRDNDKAPLCCPCAPAYGGGWWFYSCFESNLNGEYFNDPVKNGYYKGIIWELWLGDYSLKSAKMMVRPRDWSQGMEAGP